MKVYNLYKNLKSGFKLALPAGLSLILAYTPLPAKDGYRRFQAQLDSALEADVKEMARRDSIARTIPIPEIHLPLRESPFREDFQETYRRFQAKLDSVLEADVKEMARRDSIARAIPIPEIHLPLENTITFINFHSHFILNEDPARH